MRQFVIFRNPIAWAAPKLSRKSTYDIRSQEKRHIILELISQFKRNDIFPYQGPLRVDFYFEMPIPESFSKKRKAQIENDWNDNIKNWHIKKPDLTNMRKLYEDCLEGAGILSNDSIISRGITEKYYSSNPKIMIKIIIF